MPKKNTQPKKKTKTSAKKAPVEPTPVEPTPVEPTPVEPTPVESAPVESAPVDTGLVSIQEEFDTLTSDLRNASMVIKSLVTRINKLEKTVLKDRKFLVKQGKINRQRKVNKNNGFSKPGQVSDELREFLKLSADELIARTDVTKKITVYCQENDLQNKDDKRIILPNTALRKLLRLEKGDNLTYFNLQKYMKIHFPNKDGGFVHT